MKYVRNQDLSEVKKRLSRSNPGNEAIERKQFRIGEGMKKRGFSALEESFSQRFFRFALLSLALPHTIIREMLPSADFTHGKKGTPREKGGKGGRGQGGK